MEASGREPRSYLPWTPQDPCRQAADGLRFSRSPKHDSNRTRDFPATLCPPWHVHHRCWRVPARPTILALASVGLCRPGQRCWFPPPSLIRLPIPSRRHHGTGAGRLLVLHGHHGRRCFQGTDGGSARCLLLDVVGARSRPLYVCVLAGVVALGPVFSQQPWLPRAFSRSDRRARPA